MGASQSALSIQKPSQIGPRTHADEHFRTHGAAVPISSTAAGEESSAIRAVPSAPLAHLDPIIMYVSLYYLSCMSTPPPVALTAMPLCVEETRTITPA